MPGLTGKVMKVLLALVVLGLVALAADAHDKVNMPTDFVGVNVFSLVHWAVAICLCLMVFGCIASANNLGSLVLALVCLIGLSQVSGDQESVVVWAMIVAGVHSCLEMLPFGERLNHTVPDLLGT